METNDLTFNILKCAYRVHSILGPGLLASSYEFPLCLELEKAGFSFERQKTLPMIYKNHMMDVGYTVDLIIENQVIIEIVAVDELNALHTSELLTYLKLSNCNIGLLINFNVISMKDGIRRVVNKSIEEDSTHGYFQVLYPPLEFSRGTEGE